MSFQLGSLQKTKTDLFELEIAPDVEPAAQEKEKMIELPASSVEKILQEDKEMLNIARNLSSKGDQKIDPADYIDKVKEELIKSGKLGVDNYIDEQKRMAAGKGDEKVALENDSAKTKEKEEPKKSQEMAANYKGPTRIYYDLPGRTHTYLPLPIYLCQGSGKVVLSIEVNQRGDVEKAQIIEGESTTADACLVETAVTTALMSRFNPDIKSQKNQTGTLTYIFVAQ
jgi:outer membrane biosynthesis protein TonB